jgi:hypothetical protein
MCVCVCKCVYVCGGGFGENKEYGRVGSIISKVRQQVFTTLKSSAGLRRVGTTGNVGSYSRSISMSYNES